MEKAGRGWSKTRDDGIGHCNNWSPTKRACGRRAGV